MKTIARFLPKHINGLNNLSYEMTMTGQILGRRKLPVPLAKAVRKTRKALNKAREEYEELRLSEIEAYIEFDDQGNKVTYEENGETLLKFKSDEDEAQFKAWHTDLLNTVIEVKVSKVSESLLDRVGNIEEDTYDAIAFMVQGEDDPLAEYGDPKLGHVFTNEELDIPDEAPGEPEDEPEAETEDDDHNADAEPSGEAEAPVAPKKKAAAKPKK